MVIDPCQHGSVGLRCFQCAAVLEVVANATVNISSLVQRRDSVSQHGQWNRLVGGFLGQIVVHCFKVFVNGFNLFVVDIKKCHDGHWRMVKSSAVVQHEASHGFGHVCFCVAEGCTFLMIVVDLGWTHHQ